MDRVGSMSDEEAGVEFQDSAGAEAFAAEAPEAEGGKPGELEPWVTELIGRVGAGASLNANDKARLPVALQLQAQHHAAALQSQSEVAAAKVARAQSLRHSRWIWGCQLSGKRMQQFSGGCRRCGLRRSSSSALFVGVPSRER